MVYAIWRNKNEAVCEARSCMPKVVIRKAMSEMKTIFQQVIPTRIKDSEAVWLDRIGLI